MNGNYTKQSLRIAYKVIEEMMKNDEVIRVSYKNAFRTVLNTISNEYIKIDLNKNESNLET